jgi:hypothetical protein
MARVAEIPSDTAGWDFSVVAGEEATGVDP